MVQDLWWCYGGYKITPVQSTMVVDLRLKVYSAVGWWAMECMVVVVMQPFGILDTLSRDSLQVAS